MIWTGECMDAQFGARHGKGAAYSIAVVAAVLSATFSVAKVFSSFLADLGLLLAWKTVVPLGLYGFLV
jgi:hypothetical protein